MTYNMMTATVEAFDLENGFDPDRFEIVLPELTVEQIIDDYQFQPSDTCKDFDTDEEYREAVIQEWQESREFDEFRDSLFPIADFIWLGDNLRALKRWTEDIATDINKLCPNVTLLIEDDKFCFGLNCVGMDLSDELLVAYAIAGQAAPYHLVRGWRNLREDREALVRPSIEATIEFFEAKAEDLRREIKE